MEQNETPWNVLKRFGTPTGERMKDKNQTTEKETLKKSNILERVQDPDTPEMVDDTEKEDHYKIYNNIIYGLVDDFIEREYAGLTNEELKQDKAFFPLLVQYIYNNYLCNVFRNGLDYKLQGIRPVYDDIRTIDNIFNIYIDLVYRYKWNNRPSITEFSIITGISRITIRKWLDGDIDNYILQSVSDDKRKHITSEYAVTVQKWQSICEQSLVDGNGEMIKEIFLLKAVHGMRDNNNDIQITVNHKAIVDADTLPDLIGLKSQ